MGFLQSLWMKTWTCGSWFGDLTSIPGPTIEYTPATTMSVTDMPLACGRWGMTSGYWIIGIIAAIVIATILVFEWFARDRDTSESDRLATYCITTIATAPVWPLWFFLAPAAILVTGAKWAGTTVRRLNQVVHEKRMLRRAERAKQIAELQPYIDQLDKELTK